MFDPTKLAQEAVRAAVMGSPAPMVPADLEGRWYQPAAAFVSIKKLGTLRGCIGTFLPTVPSALEEIIENAAGAALRDWRFTPVTPDELDDLEYSVDVLDPPELIDDPSLLDPEVFGVIVESAGRRGLLLPDLDGVDSTMEQLAIARQKAGIAPGEEITLSRFRVTRYR